MVLEQSNQGHILSALNKISTFQAKPTNDTVKQRNMLLLDYIMYTSYPTTPTLRNDVGDMQLPIELDMT